MKRTNICPKCNSTQIKRINGSIRGYGAGNNILLGVTIFSGIPVNRYICTSCGYTEEWIDEVDIQKLLNSKNPRG